MLHWNQEQYRYFKEKVEEITRPLMARIEALEVELKKSREAPGSEHPSQQRSTTGE